MRRCLLSDAVPRRWASPTLSASRRTEPLQHALDCAAPPCSDAECRGSLRHALLRFASASRMADIADGSTKRLRIRRMLESGAGPTPLALPIRCYSALRQ